MGVFRLEFETESEVDLGWLRTPLREGDLIEVSFVLTDLRNTLSIVHYHGGVETKEYMDPDLSYVLLRDDNYAYLMSSTPLDWRERTRRRLEHYVG